MTSEAEALVAATCLAKEVKGDTGTTHGDRMLGCNLGEKREVTVDRFSLELVL